MDLAWVGVALPCPRLPSLAEVLLAVVGLPLGAGAAAVAVDLVVDADLVKHLPTFSISFCICQDIGQG